MASGDTLAVFTAVANDPPLANFSTIDRRQGHLVLDFDDAVSESAIFRGVLSRNYGGGGVTVTIMWAATSAVAGNCVWTAAWERQQEAVDDLDADSFATAQSVTATVTATSGTQRYSAITFTHGAQMDSLAIGEQFRLKITRDAANVSDTMTGDAELVCVEVRET